MSQRQTCGVAIDVSDEMRRIWNGPTRDEQGFLVKVGFEADEPLEVVKTARETLSAVLQRLEAWPDDAEWSGLLPAAFLSRCAPESPEPEQEIGPEAIAEWERQWRSLPVEEKLALAEGPWTLSDWLYYFDPADDGRGHDRHWWWWDAGIDAADHGWIEVTTTGWPFETGSLYWLIEASGGHCTHH
ncbi:hypothetical protein SAMN04489712_1193 [Thermomonospora echinospora]|uniref:Uncharacterized protein n=1 Tax=Thermomonospora echinospora TaxID=1992 RepID=A0A1H6DLT3_9ACTN|nr:hypothetical protein SAMN04489712_1193 [Thermomonospora echinospora]